MTGYNAKANALDEAVHGSESLASSECLLDNGFLRDAVSRAYYAAFHWARAVLLSKGIEPKSHRGVIQMFSLHFVKDGPITEEAVDMLAHLATYRELCDYTSSASFTEEQVREEISRARRFIEACRPFVK